MRLTKYAAAATVFVAMTATAQAEGFQRVDSRDGFVQLIDGRDLTRLGIRLSVSPAGKIEGRAFGRPVTGAWQWTGGYFCRDLYFGSRDLGPNCQVVQVRGGTVRFIADEGKGDYADLKLR